jgi:hypothetical protein
MLAFASLFPFPFSSLEFFGVNDGMEKSLVPPRSGGKSFGFPVPREPEVGEGGFCGFLSQPGFAPGVIGATKFRSHARVTEASSRSGRG